jgi:hypothetical protein
MPAETPSRRIDETIPEWCLRRRWNIQKFYENQRKGLTPEVLRVPGSNAVRITPAADAAWEKRMYALAKTDEAKRERERRSAQTSAAVKAAVAKGTHVTAQRHKARIAREAPHARDRLPQVEFAHATDARDSATEARTTPRWKAPAGKAS